jgi:nicotinamidase-related amidase
MSTDTALLVIDVQKGMFSEDDPVYDGENLLSKISTLITQARASGIPVIYVQHNGRPGDPLEPGTYGWPIHHATGADHHRPGSYPSADREAPCQPSLRPPS